MHSVVDVDGDALTIGWDTDLDGGIDVTLSSNSGVTNLSISQNEFSAFTLDGEGLLYSSIALIANDGTIASADLVQLLGYEVPMDEDNSTTNDCDNHLEGRLSDNFNFTEAFTTTEFNLVLTADCLLDNGQEYELVYQLWREGASNQMQDNAGSGKWNSYDVDESWSIGWFNPVSNVITQGGDYSFEVMLYLGSTLIDETTHNFCVNTASFDCS